MSSRARGVALLSTLAVVGVLGAGMFMVVSPLMDETQRIESSIQQTEGANTQQEQLLAEMAALQGNTDAITAAIAKVEESLPPGGGQAQVLRRIESAMNQSGATLSSMEVAPEPENAGGVQGTKVTLQATGTSQQLISLLTLVQSSGQIFKITEVQYAANDNASSLTMVGELLSSVSNQGGRGEAPNPNDRPERPMPDEVSAEGNAQ